MRRHAFGALIALTLVAAVPPTARAQETPRLGGVLKVAAIGEPPTLDIQATTTVLTYEIMWHVYEPLFTHDRAWNPIPMLAESDGVSDRGNFARGNVAGGIERGGMRVPKGAGEQVRPVIRGSAGEDAVTPLELFFDLVLVFAINQVTNLLTHEPT